jgi:hypothetical protein
MGSARSVGLASTGQRLPVCAASVSWLRALRNRHSDGRRDIRSSRGAHRCSSARLGIGAVEIGQRSHLAESGSWAGLQPESML